jgi:tetratricopeptide (TPR) repeat protein
MDPREVDAIVQRLVANPHDQDALTYAHQAGASDPRSYATLLERVGRETPDPSYASHWLSEAANVWATTLGDAHHAAEVLLLAVVKDPTQDVAADRLAQLYRDKGDVKGLVALLEKRAKLLAPVAGGDDAYRTKLAAMHEELGTLWAEPPLSQPMRALDNFKRAYETDPQSVFAIYSARELLKAQQQYADAIPLFAMEQALVADHDRKMALYRDQADVCRLAQDFAALTDTLRNLRAYAPDDPGLMQEQATSVLERIRIGEQVGDEDILEGGQLFVALAESYDGEHGYSYSLAGLEIDPTNDRAIQLATFYGEQLGRLAELPEWWKKYLSTNPNGAMAQEIGAKLQEAGEQIPAPGSVALRDEARPAQPAPVVSAKPPSAPMQADPGSQPGPAPQPEPEPEPVYSSPPAERLSPERLSALLDEASAFASARPRISRSAQLGRRASACEAQVRRAARCLSGSVPCLRTPLGRASQVPFEGCEHLRAAVA